MSKRNNPGKNSPHSFADVTINDYANSSVSINRIKKTTTNFTKVLKVDKLNDFEDDCLIEKPELRRRKKTTSTSSDKAESTGNVYSIDIWFIISDYIRPEDVGRFAGICRSSYEVVCTSQFWLSMYKRYYKIGISLPERLQPECLFPRYGLRTQVIRALNYMYPPFIARLKAIEKMEKGADILKRTQCVLMWHKKTNSGFLYYFKMRVNVHEMRQRRQAPTESWNLLQRLDDVFANQDENSRVLQVTCKKFIPLAPVFGLTLISANINDSYKLQLRFGSEIHSCSPATGGNTLITLEPVIDVKILDWWHPLYPHTYDMEYLLKQE